MRRLLCTSLSICLSIHFPAQAQTTDELDEIRRRDLGQALFFDVNLSRNRSQSCATCHDPAVALIDWRENGVARAASLGDDGQSLGDRNAPSLGYARFSPRFHWDEEEGEYRGGQFWDGRAETLVDQAKGPPLSPIEMNLADEATLAGRLRENPQYQRAFETLYGQGVLEEPSRAYQAMAESIAAFQQSDFFSPFDSKYDRFLKGEYSPSREENIGMELFFSTQFTNCSHCHQLQPVPRRAGETFTDYGYENIGVPVNTALRRANGSPEEWQDLGLADNPSVQDAEAQAGKFKTPTLRNVAVTGPYMHNGVFRDLRTVLAFYNHYNARDARRQINPETGEPWGAPEVSENLALEELTDMVPLDDHHIDALLAFLHMLTDRRYESLR